MRPAEAVGAPNGIAHGSQPPRMLDFAIRGFEVQARVIHAVILREVRTRFGAYHLGYLWAVIVPLLFISVLTFVHTALGRGRAYGVPIEVLLLSGMMTWRTFSDTNGQIASAYRSNRALLVYPMVTVIDIVIARGMLEFATKAVATFIIMILFIAAGVPAQIDDPLGVILGVATVTYFAMAYGHASGCIIVAIPSMSFLINSMRRILFFTSGALFLLSDIPAEWREYILLNPIAHIIDMVRGAWIASYSAPYYDINYILATGAALTVAAAVGEMTTRSKRMGARQ